MIPAVLSNVVSAGPDRSLAQSLLPCSQHLQSTRQFSCGRPRLCSRHLRQSRGQQSPKVCAAAAVEAPPQQATAPAVSRHVNGKSKKSKKASVNFDEDGTTSNPNALYQHFENLLRKRAYGYKQGDKVTGTVFQVDERNAYVDIGAKAPALCPLEECTQAKVQRVQTPEVPVMLLHVCVPMHRNWLCGSIGKTGVTHLSPAYCVKNHLDYME